jgi:DNA-binding beta-propeller fold protein YncE
MAAGRPLQRPFGVAVVVAFALIVSYFALPPGGANIGPTRLDLSVVPADNGSTASVSVDIGSAPYSAVFDNATGDVYVLDADGLTVISGTTVVGTLEVGGDAAICDPFGDVYVVSPLSDNVSVLRGAQLLATLPVGDEPLAGTYDPEDHGVYVANYGSANVSVLSAAVLVGTVEVGRLPRSATYDGANGEVYVTNWGSANLSVIRGSQLVGWVKDGGDPYDAVYDGANGYMYVVNNPDVPDMLSSVTVINGTSIVGSADVGLDAQTAVYDARNGDVYVVNDASDSLSVIAGTQVIATIPLWNVVASTGGTAGSPGSSVAPAYDTGTGEVFVSQYPGDNASVVAGTSVVGTLPLGRDPGGAAYDGRSGDLYVPNGGSANVSVVHPPIYHLVSFQASGLPSEVSWAVTLDGHASSGTGLVRFPGLANGTYSFTVGGVVGFAASPGSGSVTLNDTPIPSPVMIQWSPTFLGLPEAEGFAILVAAIAVLLAVAVFGPRRLLRRRRM